MCSPSQAYRSRFLSAPPLLSAEMDEWVDGWIDERGCWVMLSTPYVYISSQNRPSFVHIPEFTSLPKSLIPPPSRCYFAVVCFSCEQTSSCGICCTSFQPFVLSLAMTFRLSSSRTYFLVYGTITPACPSSIASSGAWQ